MNPPRILIDTHQLLGEASLHIGAAIRNLDAIAGPWPTTTPGGGNVGGGGHAGSGGTPRHDPALDALRRLAEHAALCAVTASDTVQAVTGQRPVNPMARPLQQTVHAYRCANLLIKGDWPTDVNLRPWHDEADTLTRLIRTHSQKPTIAAPVARGATHSPAVDLTGMWCVHCLSVGVRAPRDRGESCSWCYRFERAEGFPPPGALLNARANGVRITEAMVQPHRQAHRDRKAKAS